MVFISGSYCCSDKAATACLKHTSDSAEKTQRVLKMFQHLDAHKKRPLSRRWIADDVTVLKMVTRAAAERVRLHFRVVQRRLANVEGPALGFLIGLEEA